MIKLDSISSAIENYIFLSAVQIQNRHKFILSILLLIASFFLLDKLIIYTNIGNISIVIILHCLPQITHLKFRNFKSLVKYSIYGMLTSTIVFLLMFLFSVDILLNYTLSLASFFIIFYLLKENQLRIDKRLKYFRIFISYFSEYIQSSSIIFSI